MELGEEIARLRDERDRLLNDLNREKGFNALLARERDNLIAQRNQLGEDAVGFARQCTELRYKLAKSQAHSEALSVALEFHDLCGNSKALIAYRAEHPKP